LQEIGDCPRFPEKSFQTHTFPVPGNHFTQQIEQMFGTTEKGRTMNTQRMNHENEIAIEIEELEAKIVPQSPATFLD
jgi:hypothetical protein